MSKRKSLAERLKAQGLEPAEKKLDAQSLFDERASVGAVPDEILTFLRDVIARNDTLPISSQKRVSLDRAVEYLRKNGYNLGSAAIRSIVRTYLNRKGWGHA